jgi:hypothetical protein
VVPQEHSPAVDTIARMLVMELPVPVAGTEEEMLPHREPVLAVDVLATGCRSR